MQGSGSTHPFGPMGNSFVLVAHIYIDPFYLYKNWPQFEAK